MSDIKKSALSENESKKETNYHYLWSNLRMFLYEHFKWVLSRIVLTDFQANEQFWDRVGFEGNIKKLN